MFSNINKSIIKTSIEYYDSYQTKIDNILNNTEYIKIIENNNITNQIIFYDKNKKILLKSSYEILSLYLPEQQIWKWSWSIPTISKKYTYITRKLIDYALSLVDFNDIFIKSILTNSKIKIENDIQLDILLALFSKFTKKPFIFKYLVIPDIPKVKINNDEFIHYKEIITNKKYDKYKNNLVQYFIIIDFE